MKITPITSQSNPLLKQARGLHLRSNREKSGLFLLEGAKLVAEAFAKGLTIKDVLVSQSFLKQGLGEAHTANIKQLSVIDDRLFSEITTTESPTGIIAIAKQKHWQLDDILPDKNALVVIADAIQDPGNLGTMIRTALAAQASGMILTKGTVDPFNAKVVRSAAGALFVLPHLVDLTVADAIEKCKANGLAVLACNQKSEQMFWQIDMKKPVALLFGNEGQGFSGAVLNQVDQSIAIPMSKMSESLNVSVAAGIILYSAVQQRFSQ